MEIMESGAYTVNNLNIESQISTFIQGLTWQEKVVIREQTLNGSITEDILEELEGGNPIKLLQKLNRKLKNFAKKLGLSLQDLESEMFNYFDNEEERRKELAGAYYREDIKEKTRQIL